jgi:hypothetical protein
MVFKKGKTKDLFGYETPAYLVMVEGIVIARIFKWSVFYPKKIHNIFLKTFSRKDKLCCNNNRCKQKKILND